MTLLFRDLADGLKNWRLWTALAMEQHRRTYRHTRIGLLWIGVGFVAFAAVKIAVFSSLSQKDIAFFSTWLLAGFFAWQVVSMLVNNAANVYIGSRVWITGISVPYSIYVFKSIWATLIYAGITIVFAIPIILLTGTFSVTGLFLSLVAFVLYVLTAVPLHIVLGIICAYSRDMLQLVQTVMRIMFFATPIIWVPIPDTPRQTIADLNPFSYFISLFRDPILTGTIPMMSLAVWAGLTAFFWLLAALLYQRYRNQIVYWL